MRRFDCNALSFYGSTEVGFPVANREITEEAKDIVGWARPGYQTRVVNSEGVDVAAGQVGELWVRPPDRRLILSGVPE